MTIASLLFIFRAMYYQLQAVHVSQISCLYYMLQASICRKPDTARTFTALQCAFTFKRSAGIQSYVKDANGHVGPAQQLIMDIGERREVYFSTKEISNLEMQFDSSEKVLRLRAVAREHAAASMLHHQCSP